MKPLKPLQEWEVKVTKMEFHKCLECPKAFLGADELVTHTKRHQEMRMAYALSAYVKLERVKILGCDRCSRGFLSERLLLLHRLEHVNKSVIPIQGLYYNKDKEKPYKCPECDYAFVAKSTLDAHSVIHKPFPHICYCGIGYYKQEDLRRHQKILQCQKPEIEDTKPPNGLIKSEEKIKICSPLKEKKVSKSKSNVPKSKSNVPKSKSNVPKSKSRFKIGAPVPLPPLDVKFEKVGDRKYQCPQCLKFFAAKINAEKHYRAVHRGERPYPCHICDKKFTQTASLKQHLIMHSGVREHECAYCKKPFPSFSAKSLHERTHTGYKPYKCSYCYKTFSDPSAHNRHERIHKGDFRYRCDQCPMAFTDNSGLYAHKKRHNPEEARKHACSKCDKKFYNKDILKKHISIVHNNEYNFTCDICEKRFSLKINLINHINVQHVPVPVRKKYPCTLCDKVFYDKSYVSKHINNVHMKEKKYTCDICNRQFSEKNVLQNHMTTHNKIKKYECDYCSHKVHLRGQILIHIMSRHLGIRCKVCSRYFASQSSLEKHKLKKSEKCNFCESEFFCEGYLQTHLQAHFKEPKTYECDYCGKVFIHRIDIINHIAFHIRYKFKCDDCGDHFEYKDSLRIHMLRHSNVHCKVCRKRFFSKVDLYKHKKMRCTLRKFGCGMCYKTFKLTRDLKRHEAYCQTGVVGSREVKCPLCAKAFHSKKAAITHLKMHKDEVKTVE